STGLQNRRLSVRVAPPLLTKQWVIAVGVTDEDDSNSIQRIGHDGGSEEHTGNYNLVPAPDGPFAGRIVAGMWVRAGRAGGDLLCSAGDVVGLAEPAAHAGSWGFANPGHGGGGRRLGFWRRSLDRSRFPGRHTGGGLLRFAGIIDHRVGDVRYRQLD